MRCHEVQSVIARNEGDWSVYFGEFEFDARCGLAVGDGGVGEERGVADDGGVRIAMLMGEPFAARSAESATERRENSREGSLFGHVRMPRSSVPIVELCELRVRRVTQF